MFDTTPLIQITRGSQLEVVYRGAIAVVHARGELIASAGDPRLATFLRSSAKPFQLLPLVESGAADRFGFSERELALMAASHNGEEFHVQAVTGILAHLGLDVNALQCGIHPPAYPPAARVLEDAGQAPNPLHNNCSGKHSGMLAQCVDRKLPIETYLDPQHPIQITIKQALAELAGVEPGAMVTATDGCSVPTFAIPLAASALAFARLADPSALGEPRRSALKRIAAAMMAHPEMAAGTKRLDTEIMRACRGRVVVKGGAEGYYCMGVLPLGLGIAFKMEDGDASRGRNAVAVEILQQLGLLDDQAQAALARHIAGPVKNHRGLVVGHMQTSFQLTH